MNELKAARQSLSCLAAMLWAGVGFQMALLLLSALTLDGHRLLREFLLVLGVWNVANVPILVLAAILFVRNRGWRGASLCWEQPWSRWFPLL